MGLALYRQVSYGEVLRCMLEGAQWVLGPAPRSASPASRASRKRGRGAAPLQQLYDEVVGPIAVPQTKGACAARAHAHDALPRRPRVFRLGAVDPGSDHTRHPDGSYQRVIDASLRDRRHQTHGLAVRVSDYTLEGIADAEPIYRLITTVLDPDAAPAAELAARYHERWEMETALDELTTHLRGAQIILRSKTAELGGRSSMDCCSRILRFAA